MAKAYIIWGEVPEHGAEPVEYEFASEAEVNAFLLGVDEASGWLDYVDVPGPDYAYDAERGEAVPSAELSKRES